MTKTAKNVVRVLFVCMGNICRSPTAEGIFREKVQQAGLAEQVLIDSAGTHGYHIGAPPDQRSQTAARLRGIEIGGLRARMVADSDFAEFDYVLAMDRDNAQILHERCPQPDLHYRVQLFLDFAPLQPLREVPDPYYGGEQGFEMVFDLIEEAAQGLLEELQERHQLGGA